GGMIHFVNVTLLRLQAADQTIQGVLYFVEDKTRDVTLRHELINANAAKDQFLALLSHELRNPLSPVIAMVGELEAMTPRSPKLRQALEVIRRNVELEARMIDDLLDVTRIAKGKLQLSFEVVDVHEILQRVYEICREDIAKKSIETKFELNAQHVHIEGDPARLQQVFWNLVKNSVKFTPANGRITVATSNTLPEDIEIRISDTGIGIEEEKIGKIFNAFEQGQTSITRRFGGLGLGLAISKSMVPAHRGKIRVDSQAVEKTQREDFDLLISDIGLPDRSGYELMRELRQSKGLLGIALSGFGMEADVNKARDAGFSEHLTKPINFDRLEQAIRHLLESTS